MFNFHRTAWWATAGVGVVLGGIVCAAYTLTYGYVIVQTILPGPLFSALFQQSLLIQGLPFLAGVLLLLGIVVGVMVRMGYPRLFRWVMRRAATYPDKSGDFLFAFLDGCIQLDQYMKKKGRREGLALLTNTLSDPDGFDNIQFEKPGLYGQPEVKYLLWRAREVGGVSYLRALWQVLSNEQRAACLVATRALFVDKRAVLLSDLFQISSTPEVCRQLLDAWLPPTLPNSGNAPAFDLVKSLLWQSTPVFQILGTPNSDLFVNRMKHYIQSGHIACTQRVPLKRSQACAAFFNLCHRDTLEKGGGSSTKEGVGTVDRCRTYIVFI